MIAWALALACSEPPREDALARDPQRVLERASMDLRGVRPSPEERDTVEADPALLDVLVEDMLQDARFPGRVRALWAEVYRTRVDGLLLDAETVGLEDEVAWVRAAGEEPLRVLGELAATDAPLTELLTGEGTLVDATLAQVYPVQVGAPATTGEGWSHARWTDGRPAAGVLASNGLWLRYTSTPSNAQRGRANAIARIFLCQDFLAQPIAFAEGQDLLDEVRLRDALREDPSCTACHRTLDPLASHLFGFTAYDASDPREAVRYHPEREHGWSVTTGVAPGYYGRPSGGRLDELGAQVAADPRFARCMAEQAWSLVARRPASPEDEPAIAAVREAFVREGATVRALLRAVVADPRYATGAPAVVTPDQMASQIEALTGFRWSRGGTELLSLDAIGVIEKQEAVDVGTTGFRTLAGGVDGDQVTAPADRATVPSVLVQARLAEAAATWAVANAPERVLPGLDLRETPATGRVAMAEVLVGWHRALYGARVPSDGEEVAAALSLWEAAYAIRGDARMAWATVLTALLRDPRLMEYG